jgi:hypothetical protein
MMAQARTRVWILLGLGVGLLVLWFRSLVLGYLVQPVALLIWAAWRVIASVDQQIWWAILVAVGFIIIFRLMVPTGGEAHPSAYRSEPYPASRTKYWEMLINEAAEGWEKRQRLKRNMANLLDSVTAFDERSASSAAAKVDVGSGGSQPSEVPPIAHETAPANHGRRVPNSLVSTIRWIRGWPPWKKQSDEDWLDQTLTWMEIRLDIDDAD